MVYLTSYYHNEYQWQINLNDTKFWKYIVINAEEKHILTWNDPSAFSPRRTSILIKKTFITETPFMFSKINLLRMQRFHPLKHLHATLLQLPSSTLATGWLRWCLLINYSHPETPGRKWSHLSVPAMKANLRATSLHPAVIAIIMCIHYSWIVRTAGTVRNPFLPNERRQRHGPINEERTHKGECISYLTTEIGTERPSVRPSDHPFCLGRILLASKKEREGHSVDAFCN